MPFLCYNCNSVFEINFDVCPACKKQSSIYFHEKLCFYCGIGINLNEYLWDNLHFDEDDIRNSLTKNIVKKKEQLIMSWHSEKEMVVCNECQKIIDIIKASICQKTRLEEFIIDIIQRYPIFERIPLEQFYSERTEVFNFYFGKISQAQFIQTFMILSDLHEVTSIFMGGVIDERDP